MILGTVTRAWRVDVHSLDAFREPIIQLLSRDIVGERKMGDTGTDRKILRVLGQPEVLTAQHMIGIPAFIDSPIHARQIGFISANSS